MDFNRISRGLLRKQPTQHRARDTIEAVLQAAAQILADERDVRISTNRIAQVAGVSVGSLYQYFPKKEAILSLLIQRHLEAKFRVVDEKLQANKSASLEAVVSEIIGALVEAKGDHSRYERSLEEWVPKLGALKAMREVDDRIIARIMEYIEPYRHELVAQGEDLEVTVFVLLQAVKGVLVGTNLGRPALLSKAARPKLILHLNQLVLSYLRRSPA